MYKFKDSKNNIMAEFMESVKDIITNQYVKFDKKNEKELQLLSLQIKYNSSKQSYLSKILSTYHFWLYNMINNNKTSAKFEISRT